MTKLGRLHKAEYHLNVAYKLSLAAHSKSSPHISEALLQCRQAKWKQFQEQKKRNAPTLLEELIQLLDQKLVTDLENLNKQQTLPAQEPDISSEEKSVNMEEEKSVNIEEEKSVNMEEEQSVNIDEGNTANTEENKNVNMEEEKNVNMEEEKNVNAEEEKNDNMEEEKTINMDEDKSVNIDEEKGVSIDEEKDINMDDQKEEEKEEANQYQLSPEEIADEMAYLQKKHQEDVAILKSIFQQVISPEENKAKKLMPKEVPDYLQDPISFNLFVDPVITRSGQTYERSWILEHLRNHNTEPFSRQLLTEKDLIPNLAIKAAAEQFIEKEGQY